MLIAVLSALGVPAETIIVLIIVLFVFTRIKTIRKPDVFKARVRVIDGQFPELTEKWKKGYANWVTTVIAFRKGLTLNIRDVLPTASFEQLREATVEEVKALRLGEAPVIAVLTLNNGARIEFAFAANNHAVGMRPWELEGAV